MCLLYKYPQARVSVSRADRARTSAAPGRVRSTSCSTPAIFDDDRYFDIFIEYAKADPEDLAIRITAHNRGPDAAPLHILPTLWFRNTWAWGADGTARAADHVRAGDGGMCLVDRRQRHARRSQHASAVPARTALTVRPGGAGRCSPTTRPTASASTGPGNTSRKPHTKDAFHRAICEGDSTARPPRRRGTKAALHYRYVVPAGGTVTLRLRLTDRPTRERARRRRRDHRRAQGRGRRVLRRASPRRAPPPTSSSCSAARSRACCGRKQSYLFDVARWLDGDDPDAAAAGSRGARSATRTGVT